MRLSLIDEALRRPEAVLARCVPGGVPIVRDVLRAGITNVFGEPPIQPDGRAGDPGLCGPGSASWRCIGDPAAIVGGVRGLMLQTMHPRVMAGVHDHSAFERDTIGRLQRTTRWVITSTYGSVEEVFGVARRVRASHRGVTGTSPNGRPYAASDPALLAWVQDALTVSMLATDAAYAAEPLDRAERDRFVLEQSRLAALLDPRVDLDTLDHDELRAGTATLPMVEDGVLPTSESELDAQMVDFLDELEVNHQSREALGFLVSPPLPPVVRAAYTAVYAAAVATFTGDERRRLGLPLPIPGTVAQAMGRVHVTALRTATGVAPAVQMARHRAAA